jgi:hypothetical protein
VIYKKAQEKSALVGLSLLESRLFCNVRLFTEYIFRQIWRPKDEASLSSAKQDAANLFVDSGSGTDISETTLIRNRDLVLDLHEDRNGEQFHMPSMHPNKAAEGADMQNWLLFKF